MSKKYFYIILSIFISFSLHAQKQEQTVDSLLKAYRNLKEDTNKVKQLIRISWAYNDINKLDESIKYAQQALELASKLNWKKGMLHGYAVLGDNYMFKRDNIRALGYYDSARNTAEDIGNKEAAAAAIGNAAKVYYQAGDFKKSIEYNTKSLKISEDNGFQSNIAHSLNDIGLCYMAQGFYPKSLEYHFRALSIFEEAGLKKSMATTHINIANVFLYEKDMTKALEYYSKALKIYEETGNNLGLAYCYANIGNTFQLMGQPDESLDYFQKALKILDKTEDNNLAGNLIANIGNTYYAKHQYIKAIEFLQVSLKILNETGDRKGAANCYNSLGDCYLALLKTGPDNVTGKIKTTTAPEIRHYMPAVSIPENNAALLREAFASYREGLQISREMGALHVMQSCYEGLAAAYRQSNDYKNALEYTDSARVLKDSLFSIENNRKIEQMKLKNDYELQRRSDSVLHVQDIRAGNFKIEKQRILLWTALCVFILIIAAVVVLQRAKAARAKTEQQALFSRQLLEIELKALRAQMNPHFIFNSLNSIQAFILKENKTEASDYLQKFSQLIRLILDNSQKTSNTIEEEAEILDLYLNLEKLRLKNIFDYEISISADLDPTFTEIPSMVMQPLVENSIWHGLMNISYKGLLKVAFTREKNKLICIVEDNGTGLVRSEQLKGGKRKEHESKGMKMIEDRLQAWSQIKGLRYTFKIFDRDRDTGTRTEITILYPPYV